MVNCKFINMDVIILNHTKSKKNDNSKKKDFRKNKENDLSETEEVHGC